MFPSSKAWTDRMGQWRRLAGESHGTIPRPRWGPGDHPHGPSGLWGDLGCPSHPPGAVEGEAEPSSCQQQGRGGQRPLPGLSPPSRCQLHLEEIKKAAMADPGPKTPAGGLRGLSTPIAPSWCLLGCPPAPSRPTRGENRAECSPKACRPRGRVAAPPELHSLQISQAELCAPREPGQGRARLCGL